MREHVWQPINQFQVSNLEQAPVFRKRLVILVPVQLVHARAARLFFKPSRSIMLVMIPLQQHNLLPIVLLQPYNLHHVLKDVIRQSILPLIRVKIVAQKHHPVHRLQIPLHRRLPKQAPMHIGNYQNSFCHYLLVEWGRSSSLYFYYGGKVNNKNRE